MLELAGELGYLNWCSDSLHDGQLRNRGSVSGRGNRFSLLHSFQTRSGSHLACFLMGGWGESNYPVCPEKCSESRIVYLSRISTTSFLSFLINHSRSICHSILYTLCSWKSISMLQISVRIKFHIIWKKCIKRTDCLWISCQKNSSGPISEIESWKCSGLVSGNTFH
jgi:hypothetical protein